MTARPFLKCAGGKTALLPELLKRVPPTYGTYYEPFVGAGALFFALQPQKAVISDANHRLMCTYAALVEDPEKVFALLRKHNFQHGDEYYYKTRDAFIDDAPTSEIAAKFIYLNKTCFNGLWRVNKQGKFNVPMGDYKDPKILDEELLREASVALRHTTIVEESFYRSLARSEPENFFYLDPPYAPTSATADFTSYTKGGFTLKDQEQLAKHYRALDSWGCKLMISNSDAPLIWKLYHGFNFHEVSRSGTISSKGSARGRVPELIITNY